MTNNFFKDSVFDYLKKESFQRYIFQLPNEINQSLGNRSFIKSRWADGIAYSELENLKHTKTLLLTNNIIIDDGRYQENIHTVNNTYYGAMYCPYNLDTVESTVKDFNCLSNRFDYFRQSWFYHLVRRNWLSRGHVSFNCDIGHSTPNPTFQGLTAQEVFEKGFQEVNQIFSQEHDKIKHQIPYQNFSDSGDLTNIVLTSKFSIVLETWFHDNRVITFSEKTMRCLQLPRPWVLFTTQHGVQQLRNWGFDVLDDIVNHHYDSIADPIQRQMAILDQAETLLDIDISQVATRCQQASAHNQLILKNWHKQWFINMDKDFEIAYQKALALQ